MLKILTIQYHTKEENKLVFRESDLLPGQTEVKNANLLDLYPERRVILEGNLSIKKYKSHFSSPSGVCVRSKYVFLC